MPGFISKPHGEDLDFELFSNIVLKFTAILMVVLVLLAINVGQKLDQIISPNRFSGGLARPQLYLDAFETDNRRDNAKIWIQLDSESFAKAKTYIDPITSQTVARTEAETFSGRFGASPYWSLMLLAGISPGSIPIDGKQTPFVIPNFNHHSFVYIDKTEKSRTAPPSERLAKNFLKVWSDSYANAVYPTRAFAEYKNVRTRIYIETIGNDFIIGHSSFSAAQVKAGRLDFLTSLSSANTEVVYLGERTQDGLLDFYEKNGFADAAKHVRSRQHPGAADLDRAKDFYVLLTGWDQLAADQKSGWLDGAKGDAKIARERYELSIARRASADYRNSLLEDALKKDVAPDAYSLPSILAYPDAWQAFVDDRMKANPPPPDWFVTEFLEPLGFDKRVVVIQQ